MISYVAARVAFTLWLTIMFYAIIATPVQFWIG